MTKKVVHTETVLDIAALRAWPTWAKVLVWSGWAVGAFIVVQLVLGSLLRAMLDAGWFAGDPLDQQIPFDQQLSDAGLFACGQARGLLPLPGRHEEPAVALGLGARQMAAPIQCMAQEKRGLESQQLSQRRMKLDEALCAHPLERFIDLHCVVARWHSLGRLK